MKHGKAVHVARIFGIIMITLVTYVLVVSAGSQVIKVVIQKMGNGLVLVIVSIVVITVDMTVYYFGLPSLVRWSLTWFD